MAYDPAFPGGVRVAAGDTNGDGREEIITTPGPTGGPHVKVFDGQTAALLREFHAFEGIYTEGVYVAAGDVNGDGRADIVAGAQTGSRVNVFSAVGSTTPIRSYDPYPTFTGGGLRGQNLREFRMSHWALVLGASILLAAGWRF